MTTLRSFRFPPKHLTMLREIADRYYGGNQTQALIEAVERYHNHLNPVFVQGYVRLDRVVDADTDAECARCGKSLPSRRWIAVLSDGSVEGVYCSECAEAGEARPEV